MSERRPLRICYVASDTLVPGVRGSSTHVSQVAANLVRLGHKVFVVARKREGASEEPATVGGAAYRRLRRGIFLASPWKARGSSGEMGPLGLLARTYEIYLFTLFALYVGLVTSSIVRKNRVDVILERESSFGGGAIASYITHRPLVLEIVGPRYPRYAFKIAREVLAYTRSMLNSEPGAKVRFVRGGVDPDLFHPDIASGDRIRAALKLTDKFVVGYVGTFAKWHGIQDLIEAASSIVPKHPEIIFLLVGPNSDWVSDLLKDSRVKKVFVITGPVPYSDVPAFVNAADLLVAPYNPSAEALRARYGIGFPLKILEYMSCGKPVIATMVPPIPNLVENRVNGLLVSPGDPKGIAEAIIEVKEKPEMASQLAERARRTVAEDYSWPVVSKEIEDSLLRAIVSQ